MKRWSEMPRVSMPAAFRFRDVERLHQRQPEETLVEAPRLLGVAAAVGVVVQSLDHEFLLSRPAAQSAVNFCPFREAAKP
jgi:hypothetical protein